MKILHIIDHLSLGGAQTVVKGLIENQKGSNINYLFSLRDSVVPININHKNVFTCNSRKKYSLKPIRGLEEFIENESVDVLHCHLFRSQFFGWLVKKRYFPRVKLIFHEHGRIFKDNCIYNLFLKYSTAQTDLYLAVSEATRNRLIKNTNIPDSKIKVLYNYVDLNTFSQDKISWNIEAERIKLGINKDDFVAGFAGRIIERKGWRTFLGAAEYVLDKHPNTKFLVAGEGQEKDKLLQLLDHRHLNKNIKYIGYVSDMVWFYSLLNCFVMPSHWEPMGLTEIEAQAMGVPVISSNVEALNEIINDGENGLLFEVKNEKDLAEKIKKLLDSDKNRQELIKGGRETVKNYCLNKYITSMNLIYEDLF